MNKNLKKIILLNTIAMLSSIFCYAQIIELSKENPYNKVFIDTDNFGASYLDTLENALPKIKIDTVKFSILNDLAYYWHTRNLNKALSFTLNGLEITKAKKDTLWHGRFQITQGAILLRMEKLDSAFLVLQEAKNKVIKHDLPKLNTELGYVFERRGLIGKAADYALESLRLGKELQDRRAIALAYSDLSNLFWKQSKFDKGLEYGLKSVKIFEETGMNSLDYDFTLYIVGNNYLALQQEKEALKYYEHAIAIGERYGFYNNLSDIYISLIDLYAYLNEFEKAETAGKNAIKYAELLNNNFLLMRSWLSLGKTQNLEGKYASAIESLQKSITIATDDFGDNYYLSQAYNSLGRAYAGNHNYREAYAAFAEYDALSNKVFTAEADERISLMQTEFEVAQKENTIELQKITIEKQNLRETLIIVFSSVMFLLLLLIYLAYQNIRKKRILLQKQNQEKEFLLKEIHHRVKNNLEIVSSLLALQSAQIKDSKIVDVMQHSQNRVQAMSMIHQKLYQRNNLSKVEMKDYFVNLSSHVLDSFGIENQISVECDMKPLEVDIDMAIPLGLIVNELLTNAMKYAFPNNRKGKIIINLKKTTKDTYSLSFEDDGIGLIQTKKTNDVGFGTQLINLLVTQLGGKITRNTNDGTGIYCEFQYEKAA
ncbi:histidine kinase dimerization/phosphoacceptor domain -containing protein [Aureibaculum sp. 2210JD6-5]|uniref:sensor histidine kinase n=1 Tax=Aureibaculum sp. 2210JD6-5 TaxID=3103957 RepID=UPI002AACA608|nr:histidine kinase dimerization/phosphoacceptor domain -containing protein [Aureibaculum sp. 2210JD6-5]MDY7395095.1 histidine kinase dimerization/phosphoacceptor domain -containing protein [Aureibaculum sp. 2210JD6-5]